MPLFSSICERDGPRAKETVMHVRYVARRNLERKSRICL